MYDKEKIIGIIGIIHFPHPKNPKIKKVTRLVVLPDYQGIGIGTRFLNEIAKFYDDYDFNITTSAKNLIHALNKNDNWTLKRYDVPKKQTTGNETFSKVQRKVKTATFKYVNKN